MSLTRGWNPMERVVDFLSGDLREAPFTTVVHIAQYTFTAAVVFVLLFCGTNTGG